MTEKEQFIKELKQRTKKFAVDVIKLCDSLRKCKASDVIIYQLVKSATSTGANYRAACRSRSQAESYSKICIVVEEIDESEYWLEVILDSELYSDINELKKLAIESNELSRIMTKAKDSTYKKNKPVDS